MEILQPNTAGVSKLCQEGFISAISERQAYADSAKNVFATWKYHIGLLFQTCL